MWALILVPFISRLPYWLSAPLSLLVAISLLSSLVAAGMLLSVEKRKRLLREEIQSDLTGQKSIDTNGCSTISKVLDSSPVIGVRKVVFLLTIGMLSSYFLAQYSMAQRGYCQASGDFAHSDNMTVLKPSGENRWLVKGKDGNLYDFFVCPSTPMNLPNGTYIEFADYEYRNGCSDFTSPQSRLKFR